jgi:hypothetical protein
VCGMARNLQTAATVSHHAQTVPHYSAGYSSGCADFFEFNSGKDIIAVRDCSLRQCHL